MMALRAAELRRLLLLRGDAVLPLSLASRCRPASTAARDDEGAASNAYDVLGVGETSSSAEIKASFHRLAKETYPDVAAAAGSRRFLQILAAYEILSDSQRRAHYDSFLRSQRLVIQKHPRPSQRVYPYGSGIAVPRESNVVEWLKWYRLTVDDIVTKKRIATGSSYFDRLESELYSAIHTAYYGPEVDVVSLWINLLKNWATKLIILWQTYLRACKRHLDHPVAADDPTIVSCSSGQFLKCVGTASGALPVVPVLAEIGQLG